MNQLYKFWCPIAGHFHSFPGSWRLCRQKPGSATTVEKVEPGAPRTASTGTQVNLPA